VCFLVSTLFLVARNVIMRVSQLRCPIYSLVSHRSPCPSLEAMLRPAENVYCSFLFSPHPPVSPPCFSIITTQGFRYHGHPREDLGQVAPWPRPSKRCRMNEVTCLLMERVLSELIAVEQLCDRIGGTCAGSMRTDFE
jgi:hypothetical protein